MSRLEGFLCSRCGQHHDVIPMSFGADAPVYYEQIPLEERVSRCKLTEDICVVDNEHFFINGCLEIPVVDGTGPFVWNVWTTLSRKNFERALELWNTEGREAEPPYFSWLSTALPYNPSTLNLKTYVHTRPVGQRPSVELEPTNHPLSVEQHNGITMARVKEITESILHPGL